MRTESAYTEDAAQIVSTVNSMRDAGFVIEMADFGSGYSSLNMISHLPIDVMKLDMLFIRNAFSAASTTKLFISDWWIRQFTILPLTN